MSFEKRHYRRVRCDFEVEIHYRKSRIFIARARDLSTSGMYLRSASLQIPTGMMVEMQFSLDGQPFSLAALVARQDEDGIGVMFREYQPALPILAASAAAQPLRQAQDSGPIPPPRPYNDRLLRLSADARF